MQNFVTEIKAADPHSGTFSGMLATYGNVDRAADVIEPGAFTSTIKANGGRVPLLWAHDHAQPIGLLTLTDTAKGLQVYGELALEVRQAQEAHALLRRGVIKGLSIGYRTLKSVDRGGVRHLQQLELFEGSLVTVPCNPLAQVDSVKSSEAALIHMLNEWGKSLAAEIQRGAR